MSQTIPLILMLFLVPLTGLLLMFLYAIRIKSHIAAIKSNNGNTALFTSHQKIVAILFLGTLTLGFISGFFSAETAFGRLFYGIGILCFIILVVSFLFIPTQKVK